jgi:hypothetical protein
LETLNDEKSTAVLYHCTAPAALGPLLLHRLTINEKKPAVLIIDRHQFLKRKIDIEALAQRKLFDQIILANAFSGRQKKNESVASIEATIVSQYDSVLLKYGFSIENFGEIYTINDWWEGEFNVYLSLKQAKYYWLEPKKDCARVGNTDYIFQRFRLVSDAYAEIMKKHFATCSNGKCAILVLIEGGEKSEKYCEDIHKPYTIWNPEQLQENLSSHYAENIVGAYGAFDNLESKSALLLCMSDAWILSNNVEEQNKIPYGLYIDLRNSHCRMIHANTIALDYYVPFEKKLYIKPHPSLLTPIETVAEPYGDETESLGIVPFEMLSRYFQSIGFKFDTVLGYGSAANRFLAPICVKSIVLSQNYWSYYFLYNSLFVSLQFAKSLSNQVNTIRCTQAILEQCQALEKWGGVHAERDIEHFEESDLRFPDRTFVLIDSITKENRQAWLEVLNSSSEEIVFSILDVGEDHVFYDQFLRPFLVPIRIKKSKLKEDTLDPCRDETLWIFSKNEAARKMARCFALEKTLPRLGVKLEVNKIPVSDVVDLFQKIERT